MRALVAAISTFATRLLRMMSIVIIFLIYSFLLLSIKLASNLTGWVWYGTILTIIATFPLAIITHYLRKKFAIAIIQASDAGVANGLLALINLFYAVFIAFIIYSNVFLIGFALEGEPPYWGAQVAFVLASYLLALDCWLQFGLGTFVHRELYAGRRVLAFVVALCPADVPQTFRTSH
jgi:hypothetical protein